MIIIKSPPEIEAMRRAGAMVGQFFEEVERHVRSGVATRELEEFAEEFVTKHGVRGAFKGYLGYPANLCTSINEEVVHGIPSGTRRGDISAAIQEEAEGAGFSVVRDFVGHGIGRTLHEEPQVPNFGTPGTGPKLMPGMGLAIEPLGNEGLFPVEGLPDGG